VDREIVIGIQEIMKFIPINGFVLENPVYLQDDMIEYENHTMTRIRQLK
jgi:hypothetical protein